MIRLGLAAVLVSALSCAAPRHSHPDTAGTGSAAKPEDCFYDCKGGPNAAGSAAAPAAGPAGPAPVANRSTPAGAKAADLRDAADLLDKAAVAKANGNKSLAENYFSTAELVIGEAALAALAPEFREGGPPRVATATTKVDAHAPPQPRTVGSSEAEDAEAKVAPPRIEGSLSGSVTLDGKALSGAFGLITLEPASGKWAPRTPKHRTIEQRNREFLPHVTAIPVGSTIEFPNFDTVFHNVFSTSPLASFDLGIYKMGEAREFTFGKEGIIRLGCNLHANMSAYIAVVSAPAYVITDDKGAFSFKHLPPGKYKLKAWSERSANPVVQEVTIKAGANELSVGMTGDAASGPTPDKFGRKRG